MDDKTTIVEHILAGLILFAVFVVGIPAVVTLVLFTFKIMFMVLGFMMRLAGILP